MSPARIGAADVDDFVLGAKLLSGGGASHGTMPSRWLRHAMAARGDVGLVPPGSLPPETQCLAVGFIGSPTIQSEKLPAAGQFAQAVRVAESRLGHRAGALAALNAAGVNALAPLLAATELGLPVADADGMGRIFPYVERSVFTLAGLPVGPCTLAGAQGDVVTIEPSGNMRAEALIRPATIALGGWCVAVLYPMSAALLDRHGIHGSVGRVLEVGRTLRRAAASDEPRGRRLAADLGGRLLLSGLVDEVHRPSRRGFPRGAVIVTDLDDPDRSVRLETQNEYMLAIADGVPLAAVPDLICTVDHDTCEPVDIEQLHYGHVVDVITLPAAAAWHTDAGRALAGPEAFGYALPRARVPAREGTP